MAEYIDREIVKTRLCNNCDWEYFFSKCRCLKLEAIDKIPSANVRPVVRGKWLLNGRDVECSVCGTKCKENFIAEYEDALPPWNYCPWCGAEIESE